MDQMLAVRLHIPSRTLRIEEIRRPQPGPGQVLVKVEAAGVCLSDAHLIDGTLTPLLLDGDTVTLGHEVSGTIAETGAGVTAWSVGQRVVLYAGEVRDGATHTRGVDYDGGWAEYALSSATALTELPDSIPFEQGAIIPDAVSTPWGAITATGAVRPAEAVGVWGAGGLGVHAVQLLRAIGACPIIAVDPSGTARERALAAGADLALDPADSALRETVAAATGGTGLAAAFDFAGVPAVREQALTVLAPKGRLVLVGLTDRPLTVTDGTRFSYLQQQILGHYGSDMPVALPQLLRLVQSGRLDFAGSVSDVLPLARAAEAVDILNDRTTSPIRLVLRP
ncbi:D-arabinose 1-dehydrogenase, Zn-dependent alcohol dehydrogenase family [Streptomyces sp. BpilaLS-43]|uniref:zinc-binding dehydrogenase n=1 Tax=Streptomyces sp. BpilaLS-43 TaxID=1839778 RepID=UPI00081BAD96|nr:zinc-binding dehydrogenase [Streptomyces sp. BpilaLS-43]SCD46271.1 D-arabinose 1-dehydrogenase, Zn-dependent alcohol dehydrogenase family [Streptomyces sp. BpilaLS-43]